ncbi:hypothetical protein, conserved [Eimeria praecox]|uniref:Uncharacterized protein n=1 Tax=Eimeria praecox TaxID=51316 RepID=U6H541_9EIME|nr:hypothetical protein, conserved [Eimeria praecox]
MEFIVGDHSGLCKELSWLSADTRRTRIIKRAKQSRSLEVTALCWAGPSGGKEVSEIAVGRACGSVEGFATSSIVCEAPLHDTPLLGENSLHVPLRSFQLPSTPVALSIFGSAGSRAHTRSLLCKSWLASGVTTGEASLRSTLLPLPTEAGRDAEEDSSCSSGSSRLLLAVGQKGHACVVEWEGYFNTRIVELSSEPGGVTAFPDEAVERGLACVPVQFLPIEKNSSAGPCSVQTGNRSTSFGCRVAYLLPGPIAAACSHPLCHSLLAFGGKENDAKVVDLDYGRTIWCAKNVKPSFLGLRCDVSVTKMEWLLPVHPMVLAVGTARGALRFYDLRCQRRPVLEVCEATQEKRPVTALCVRPTAEVLQSKTDIRVALAHAAETAASCSCCDPEAANTSTRAADRDYRLLAKKGSPEDLNNNSCDNTAAAEAAQKLLASCSGKESATVYYADSYGMIYGMSVQSGSALLRLADKTCPKYNPSSYRSLSVTAEKERPPDVKRKLLAAMLDKQRERLSSKKNDHPVSTAACIDLQLGAVSLGGFKGAMGAILGLGLDPSGEHLIAVGLGRYAYVFNAKSRKLCKQVFLKQKLTCLLAGGGQAAGGVRRHKQTKEQAASESSTDESDSTSSELEEEGDSDRGDSADCSASTEAGSRRKAGGLGDELKARTCVLTRKLGAAPEAKSKKRKRVAQPLTPAGKRLG